MTIFTDRQLLDFLDGKLSDPNQTELVAALSQDPELETRLMALDDVAPLVRDAFADIGNTRVTEKILPTLNAVPKQTTAWRQMAIAASIAAAIAVFGTSSLISRNADPGGWMQQVAAYQALYSTDTIKTISSTDNELISQLSLAESALSISLPKETLAQIDGLELRRTQMLSYDGQPLAQIVFSDNEGRPIALCIMLTADAPQSGAVNLVKRQGLESAAFSSEDFGFLLIGPTDASAISRYAHEIMGALAQG